MADRIDHAAHAQDLLDDLLRVSSGDPAALELTGAAQTHATLALVEQQRIANLIELSKFSSVHHEEALYELGCEAGAALIEYERIPATPIGGPGEVPRIRAEIKNALGLA